MKCPFCGHLEDKVVDSRTARDGISIRRRRECLECKKRFTSYEKIEDVQPMVVKKDGRRERFDSDKIQRGVRKACEKRPISTTQIDDIVAEVERTVQELAEKEVSSQIVGKIVMERLAGLDGVAYVRFASVYRDFRDVNEFLEEIRGLLHPMGREV
jgi:transcriptional repressor NrdR